MVKVSGANLRSSMAHSKMVEDILHDIATNALKPGDRIASEVQLREKYGISITSIRRGMETLVERGILMRQRGSGTFVAERIPVVHEAPVRRETIGYYELWDYGMYHPYFSEKTRGIRAGLQQYGWKIWDICAEPYVRKQMTKSGRVLREIEPHLLALELEKRSDLAGVISHEGYGKAIEAHFGNEVECINMGHNPSFAFVDYNWPDEIVRLLRDVIGRGATRIAIVGSFTEQSLDACLQAAAQCEGGYVGSLQVHYHTLQAGKMRNEYVHAAFAKTRELFEMSEPAVDALVGTSDCEVEGMLEALRTIPRENWTDVQVTGIVNKATELSPDFPLRVLVADGYAHGLALAELMHKRLTAPRRAPKYVTLSCNWEEYPGE